MSNKISLRAERERKVPEYRFNPAPGWPEMEPDWIPPKNWRPDPTWPHAPQGWEFWSEVRDPYQPPDDYVQAVKPQEAQPWSWEVSEVEPKPKSWFEPRFAPSAKISPRSESFNGIPIIYNRQQHGHSLTLHLILALFTFGISLIWTLYYAASPNHYWHF